jgi:hypothetical protein
MKYLLLKHYRGGPANVTDWPPMDQWTPEEVDAHVQFMRDFAARLEETGEFIDVQALAPGGTFVRYDGEGRGSYCVPESSSVDVCPVCVFVLTEYSRFAEERGSELTIFSPSGMDLP